MDKLSDMPNIGSFLEEQLIEVGINTPSELIDIGSKNAWLKIQEIDKSACINRLLALEGAIEGIKKVQLNEDIKTNLKQFYQEHKLSNWKE